MSERNGVDDGLALGRDDVEQGVRRAAPTNEKGRWVRAAVPGTNSFVIRLNTALSSSAVVSWFVLD